MSGNPLMKDIDLLLASVEHSADGVFLSGPDLTFTYVNNRACEMLGYSREELLDLKVPDVELDFYTYAPNGERPRELFEGRTVTWYGTHRRKDGSTFPVEARVKVLHSDTGRHVLALVRDLTERKIVHENEKRAAILEERESFMAALAHDIKNPLVGADHILQFLLSGSLGELQEEQIKILQKLKESNRDLIDLLHNLIDVYHFDSHESHLELTDIDLGDLLSQTIADYKSAAAIDFVRPEEPVTVRGHRGYLKRLVIILLNNAVRFGSGQEKIELRLSRSRSGAKLQVHSDAYSLTERELEKIFDRTWQGLSGEHRYSPSTGLGLHLCKQIAEAHGADIECVSGIDRGTTFVVTIPDGT